MSKSWKRFLSLLLALTMILSLGAAGFADDGVIEEAAEETEETEEGTLVPDPDAPEEEPAEEPAEPLQGSLEMREISPETLNIPKLGREEAEESGRIDLVGEDGELIPMDEERLDKVVRVSIFLDDPATLSAGFSSKGVANNDAAIAYRNGLRAQQDAMTAQIESVIGHELNVHWNLTLAVNAISAELSLGEIVKVEHIPGVRSVERETIYFPLDDGEGSDAEPNTANTSEYMVGATAAWAAGYTGAGSRIAIIDTGLDTTHQSFDADAFDHAITEDRANGKTVKLLTRDEVSNLASQLNSKSSNYVSTKIPYGYNYVDKNTTINHLSDTQGEHGSHVAGIAAANRYIKSGSSYNDAASTVHAVGMAPDAQLLVMKVFGSGGGAAESDYFAAIEDAIVLGVDVCNLSLGSGTQGWTFAGTYQATMNDLADRSKNEGMVVSISAGNSYDLAYMLENGELYVEDVSMHTGGSPGTYVNSLCVAAAENIGNTGAPLQFGDTNVFYDLAGESAAEFTSIAGTWNYVYINAPGNASDYSAVNSAVSLSGKIVIINRGSISFADKATNANSYSPKGLIIANNVPGSLGATVKGYTGSFPVATISLESAQQIKDLGGGSTTGGITYYTGTVAVTTAVQHETTGERKNAVITDFSSWGVPGSLIMKPEITAPGGNIYSVYGTNKTSSGTAGGSTMYELMSGTSMAAPHITGLSGVVAQYLRDNPISDRNAELAAAYSNRAIIQSLLMSTATPMIPGGFYLPVLQQGAGLADVHAAVTANSVVMMDPANSALTGKTGAAADGKVKVELGDDPDRGGAYDFGFTIYNLSDEPLAFNLDGEMFTQATEGVTMSRDTSVIDARFSFAYDGYTPVSYDDHDVDHDGDTDDDDAQAILDCLSGEKEWSDFGWDMELRDWYETLLWKADLDGDGEVTSHDAYLILVWEPESGSSSEDQAVVPAHGKLAVTAHVTLPAATKSMLDTEYPGGAYLQGFVTLVCDSETREGVTYTDSHSIPLLGFYGSWTDAAMFDTNSYVEQLYGNEQTNYSGVSAANTNYMRVKLNGETVKFSGNPYQVEDSFPADRLAMNSDSTVVDFAYNLIRSAGTTGYAACKLGADGKVSSVLGSAVSGTSVQGLWYSASQGAWQNTGTKIYSANKKLSDYSGLAAGDRFRVGFYAIPEYNAMLVNDSYNAAGSGKLSQAGFNRLLESNVLGKGAFVGYDFTVDNTAPVITDASLSGSTLSITASDNLNLAYVAVLSLDGSVKYKEAVPAGPSYTISLDASDAIANAQGYVAVFAGDYAGNEAAKAVRVNDNAYEEKTVYVLADTLTAGNDYLIVNRSTAGSGYALGYTSGTWSNTVTANAVTVKAGNSGTDGKLFIESADAASTSVWTSSGSTGSTYLKNGSNYLRRNSRTGTTLQVSTTNSYNTWQYSSNQLRFTDRATYLRYSNGFSLTTTASTIYLYQKTTIRSAIDPYAVTGITLTPTSLDLYKGNVTDLTAKVLPLTASDRTVTWSSSNESVATVDASGHVTALAAGSATITATANGDPTISADCAVTVTVVNKTLNAAIWDEEGQVFFSSFNANALPDWSKLHNDGKGLPIHSVFYQNSTTYAVTLDTSSATSTLYTVDNSYNLTEVDTMAYYGTDFAPGPTSYASNYGIMVQPYGPYLLVGTTESPSEGVYGGTDMSATIGDGVYIAGVAAKSLSSTSAVYYFLDENGKIWQSNLSYSSSFSFSTPSLVVDTGISTSFLYQSLYYDGIWIYWSHQADNEAELIIINPSTGKVFHAGNFGEGVWPAAGLYVRGSVAPASIEDETEEVLAPLAFLDDLSFLDEESVIARVTDAFSDPEEPADPELPTLEPVDPAGPDEDEGSIGILEPVVEEDETDAAFSGSLNAFRGPRPAAPSVSAPDPQTVTGEIVVDPETPDTVTITVTESEAVTNGLFALLYEPDVMTLVSANAGTAFDSHDGFSSIYVDKDKCVITVAYASRTSVPADTPIAVFTFTVSCEEGAVCEIDTLERNEEIGLDEIEEIEIPAGPHAWGEPVWSWTGYTAASATFTCANNEEHTQTVTAAITSERTEPGCETDGSVVYTATVTFNGKTYTDSKTETLTATGHTWSFVGFTWVGNDTEGYTKAVANYRCDRVNTHTDTLEITVGKTSTDATCTTPGTVVYTAAVSAEASLDKTEHSETKTVTGTALGHNYELTGWSWTGYTGATATFTCKNDGTHKQSVNAAITSAVTTEATCEKTGVRTYTATASFEGKTYTDTKMETLPATGHNYELTGWSWTGYTGATATFTCKNDGTHKQSVNAAITSAVTTEATCEKTGVRTYTATASFEGKTYTDTKTETLPATGHAWGEPAWSWTGYTAASATFTCANNEEHTQTVTAAITSERTEPGCETDGSVVYTATVTFNGKTYTDTKTETLPATGHAWGEPAWSWTGYTAASATFTCTKDTSHTRTVTAAITSETANGVTTYTATVVFNGKTYTDVKTESASHEHADADGDLFCDSCGVRMGVAVTVSSASGTLSGSSVSFVQGGGKLYYGQSTTLKALAAAGYVFQGWYLNGELVTTEMEYVFTASETDTEDLHFIALYTGSGVFDLFVTGSKFKVSILSATQRSYFHDKLAADTELTITFVGNSNETFLYWVNASGKIVSTSPETTFRLVANTELHAVFSDADTTQTEALVVFVNSHTGGQVLVSHYYTSEDTVVFPSAPSRMGRVFTGWSMTEDEIKAAMATQSKVVVYAEYESSGSVTVTVKNNVDSTERTVTIPLGSDKTITADASLGEFSYWLLDGKVFSYCPSIVVSFTTDRALTAVYGEVVTPVPVVTMTESYGSGPDDEGNFTLHFVAIRSVPSGYTLERQGIVYTTREDLEGKDLKAIVVLDGEGILTYTSPRDDLNGVTAIHRSRPASQPAHVYARGFVIVMKDGVSQTIYSDEILEELYTP